MEKLSKIGKLVAICALLSLLPFSQGLDCFHCYYLKDMPINLPIAGHPRADKCEKKVPDDYTKTCTYPLAVAADSSDKNASTSSTFNDEADTCVKIHAKWEGSELVLRTCIPKSVVIERDETRLGTCTTGNLHDLATKYNIDLGGFNGRPVNIEAACFCDGNNCNSARPVGVGGGRTGWIFAVVSILGIFHFG